MITGQISSVWLLSSNMGSFVGSLAGASVFDALGMTEIGIKAIFSFVTIVIISNCLFNSHTPNLEMLSHAHPDPDQLFPGFQMGTAIEACVLAFCIIILTSFALIKK